MSKVIGILGGMGPLATVDLFKKIVENTPVTVEQDHLRIIIVNNPKIPSRIEAILKGTSEPLPEIIKSAKDLENAGADFILIPCHTAHYWLNQIQRNVKVQIVSIIDCTTAYVKKNCTPSDKILLLASEATVKAKMYQNAFYSSGLNIIIPHVSHQKTVTQAIQDAKAGRIGTNRYLKHLSSMLDYYYNAGISAVLGCCTEIPLLFPYLDSKLKKLDPTTILAKYAVALANR